MSLRLGRSTTAAIAKWEEVEGVEVNASYVASWVDAVGTALKKSDEMMFSDEAVERVVKGMLSEDDGSWCECRRSPFDPHDVNPPCKTVRGYYTVTRKVFALMQKGV